MIPSFASDRMLICVMKDNGDTVPTRNYGQLPCEDNHLGTTVTVSPTASKRFLLLKNTAITNMLFWLSHIQPWNNQW